MKVKLGMVAVIATFFATALVAQNLSLKEKKAIEKVRFDIVEKTIEESCGKPVKISLDISTFAGDIEAMENVQRRGVDSAGYGLEKLCKDATSREAFLAKKISKIVITHSKDMKRPAGVRSDSDLKLLQIKGDTLFYNGRFASISAIDYGVFDFKGALVDLL
jgi:hypothetical protein